MTESNSEPFAKSVPARTKAVIIDFLRDLKLRGRTTRTIEAYGSSLYKFFSHFPTKPPSRIGVSELRTFLASVKDDRGQAGKTISRDFSALGTFFDYLEFEKKVATNPIPGFRRRYLSSIVRQARKAPQTRDVVSVEDLRLTIHGIANTRDRTIVALLAKTGIRRQELVSLDVSDIDWKDQSILLKPTAKRTNRKVYFDGETGRLLRSWLHQRKIWGGPSEGPLFTTKKLGTRIGKNHVYDAVTTAGARAGFHKRGGTLKEKFGPHHLRHWFTTHLRRAGMEREDISELRGDVPREVLDIYLHTDHQALREKYLRLIPQLGL